MNPLAISWLPASAGRLTSEQIFRLKAEATRGERSVQFLHADGRADLPPEGGSHGAIDQFKSFA
jgi:hypothetical protein